MVLYQRENSCHGYSSNLDTSSDYLVKNSSTTITKESCTANGKITVAVKAQEQRSGTHPGSISRCIRHFLDDHVHIIKFCCSSFLIYKMDREALVQDVLCFETEMKEGLKGLQLRRNCTLLTMAALLSCFPFQLMHYSGNLAYH